MCRLDRAAMRAIVFAENGEQARLKLEAITHPAINAELTKQAFAATGPYVVMELPLLVEKQNYEWLDRVLIVDTTEAEQLIRLERRSNIKGTQASAMLAAQASRAERLAVADDVFERSLRKGHPKIHVKVPNAHHTGMDDLGTKLQRINLQHICDSVVEV